MRPNKKNLTGTGTLAKLAYYLGKRQAKKNPAKFDRCVKAVKKRGGAANAYAVCRASIGNGKVERYKLNLGRSNPYEESVARYTETHGRPPDRDTLVKVQKHYHSKLPALGELKELLILSVTGDRQVKLEGFKGAKLAETEKKPRQLYIKGGDQSVNLKDFGITEPHELEILGAMINAVYFTTKDHLMPEDGGTANYKHKFGKGRTVKAVFGKKGRLPMVGYDVRNKLLSIQGGTYTIVAEGIDG